VQWQVKVLIRPGGVVGWVDRDIRFFVIGDDEILDVYIDS
jgi:hypothetical protein